MISLSKKKLPVERLRLEKVTSVLMVKIVKMNVLVGIPNTTVVNVETDE
jgi:hypothetical protein